MTTAIKNTTVIIPRFIHVVDPLGSDIRRVQTASEQGKLTTYDTTQSIFNQVLGEIHGDSQQYRSLGLRKLTRVKFRGHLDPSGKLVAVDIVPKRAFVRGAAPSAQGRALTKGFQVTWVDEIKGFDVREPGVIGSGTYAGMEEKTLFAVLDGIRDFNWKGKTSATIEGHKVEKIEADVFRVKPLNSKLTFADDR